MHRFYHECADCRAFQALPVDRPASAFGSPGGFRPLFSIWSPYDKLNDGAPTHWTNEEKPLEGLLRVDGKTYRFLGVKNTVFETIVPMADEGPWAGMVSFQKQGAGWERPDFDDSKWNVPKALSDRLT